MNLQWSGGTSRSSPRIQSVRVETTGSTEDVDVFHKLESLISVIMAWCEHRLHSNPED